MKITYALKLASATLIAVASINAWSQSGSVGTTQTSSSMEASAPSESPKAMKKADRALAHKVRAALIKNKITVDALIVRVKDGKVWLEGSVPIKDEADDATSVARQVAGVTDVKNALTLKEAGR
jgi:osmotically-inducible protein OsmY